MKRCAGLILLGALAWGVAAVRADEKKGGTKVTLGGLTGTAPAAWKDEAIPPALKRFRVKQFRLPRAGEDKQDAQLVVYFFQGSGGSAAENVKRWKGMFNPPKGKAIDDVSKVDKFKVGDVEVTELDVRGTYKDRVAPFDPNSKTTLRPDYRMLGVVFETKQGPYFIRLVGPEKTVAHYHKGFQEFLKSFKK